ncbi:MAG: hypothetical protein ACRDPT_07805 [Streptomycetales bacterium]
MDRGNVEVEVTGLRKVKTPYGPLFAELRYVFTGHDGEPDVVADIKVVDGRPELVNFTATMKPSGRGLRSVDVGMNVDKLIEVAYAMVGFLFRQEDISRTAERARRGRPRRMTPALLEKVARIYSDDDTGAPTKAVQDALDLGSRRTAQLYVQKARDARLLPPVKREGGPGDGQYPEET